MFRGFAVSVPGQDLPFLKGSILQTTINTEESKWYKDLVFHSDFALDTRKGEPQPMNVMTVLKGETPLDMGSLSKNPKDGASKIKGIPARGFVYLFLASVASHGHSQVFSNKTKLMYAFHAVSSGE